MVRRSGTLPSRLKAGCGQDCQAGLPALQEAVPSNFATLAEVQSVQTPGRSGTPRANFAHGACKNVPHCSATQRFDCASPNSKTSLSRPTNNRKLPGSNCKGDRHAECKCRTADASPTGRFVTGSSASV